MRPVCHPDSASGGKGFLLIAVPRSPHGPHAATAPLTKATNGPSLHRRAHGRQTSPPRATTPLGWNAATTPLRAVCCRLLRSDDASEHLAHSPGDPEGAPRRPPRRRPLMAPARRPGVERRRLRPTAGAWMHLDVDTFCVLRKAVERLRTDEAAGGFHSPTVASPTCPRRSDPVDQRRAPSRGTKREVAGAPAGTRPTRRRAPGPNDPYAGPTRRLRS